MSFIYFTISVAEANHRTEIKNNRQAAIINEKKDFTND
jgi:hypothetical protein